MCSVWWCMYYSLVSYIMKPTDKDTLISMLMRNTRIRYKEQMYKDYKTSCSITQLGNVFLNGADLMRSHQVNHVGTTYETTTVNLK